LTDRVKRKWLTAVVLMMLTAAGCAGGGRGGDGAAGSSCTPDGTTLHLLARSTRFSVDCLAVPADVSFSVSLDNQDAGVPHSFGIYDRDPAADPSAKQLFKGGSVTGPSMQTYRVGSLRRGAYHFRCDVHPDRMFGSFLVGG
jgi:hypothetical protein